MAQAPTKAAKATQGRPLKAMSVRLENRPGEWAECARVLADAGVNLEGVEAEILGQFAFFRFFTTDEAAAEAALRKAGMIITISEILEVNLSERAGELARALETLAKGNVNCESIFGSASGGPTTRTFLRVSDSGKAFQLLEKAGFDVARHSR